MENKEWPNLDKLLVNKQIDYSCAIKEYNDMLFACVNHVNEDRIIIVDYMDCINVDPMTDEQKEKINELLEVFNINKFD